MPPKLVRANTRARKKKENKAPTRRGWTTVDQEAFLESHKSSFLMHQSQKNLQDFWPSLLNDWFTNFPLGNPTDKDTQEGLTEEQRLERAKTRVQQWYNNHTRVNGGKERQGKRKLLDLRARKQKILPDWQAYSHLYYEERVKPDVDAEWPTRREALKESGQEDTPEMAPLWFRNQVTKRKFGAESDEVKAEVEEYRKQTDQSIEDEGTEELTEAEKEEHHRVHQAKAYQK
ncbi:hypothetical protein BJ138DRAFT_1018727 [Hygrophoropsis aurantiaca]|uniref:Uncharacterized protein n=1 Tax=Hygrophoropsis aurantiaca TaxID=72124 RepID=A0ACB7ZUH1_9AGAM|nr:hypothetical protein BJ138DRAFT_1018727 [Hygrophoropsis aurantiaca]